MSPEYLKKWEHILEDVEKSRIPIQFIKKFVCRLEGKKQHTINVQILFKQGLEPEEVEEVVTRKMNELDIIMTSFEIVLNVEAIAKTVQPETDKLLNRLTKE